MTKTKIKKALAILALWALVSTNFWVAIAAQIGTGTVTWTTSFDSAINWDWTYTTWSASGSISWIVVTATVEPVLNMTISTWAINLWVLWTSDFSTWSVNLEIWTNAINWVVVTARSNSGWLANTSDNSIIINDDTQAGFQDWVAENYKFSSSTWATADSTISWFNATATLDTEVNENTTEHTVYTSNKPEQNDQVNDVVFTVSAKANAQTPAWSYQDTITFTVTWNF